MELSERKQRILSAIVEQYIRTGEPVGSKGLAEALDLSISSATIRNEMSELAEAGLLEQPHTSAGRIPTQKGYRYYVDHLMPRQELSDAQRKQIDAQFDTNPGDPERVLEQAGEVLADLTNCAAVSTTPADEGARIGRVELVPISGHTAMVVLLTSTGILKTGVCRTDAQLTPSLMEAFTNIIAKHFLGRPVAEVGTAMIQTLAASLGERSLAMTPLLVTLSELAHDAAQSEVMLEGQANLLSHNAFGADAYELLEFLRRTEPLEQLIAQHTKNLRVLIGRENMYRELANTSMILARYQIRGHAGGALGIIGPTRIDYAQLIPNIEYLTALVGKLLSEALDD